MALAWKASGLTPTRVRPAAAGRPADAGRIPSLFLESIMFYVYILQSLKDEKFYIGSSGDLKRRMDEHGKGKVASTKNRRPLKLVCYEAYLTKEES